LKHLILVVLLVGLTSGCAANKSEQQAQSQANSAAMIQADPQQDSSEDANVGDARDPFEGFNRTMWDFNYDILDKYLLKPVTQGYVAVMPQPVRTGLVNFSNNLAEPANFLNNLLQGEIDGSMVSLARFLINTTVGVVGVFDVASSMDLNKEKESFGEVLGVWGLETGPYLMIPARGPTDIRSTTGDVVDNMMFPMNILNSNFTLFSAVVGVIEGRARLLSQDSTLNSSLDPYVFVKTAYFQRLEFKVKNGKVEKTPEEQAEEMENFEEFEGLLDDL
jgi:phospholipid-binding lipoprotein MlaA